MTEYKNAYEVFPPELVEEIQEHFSGGVLWIPKDYESRNREICRMKKKGFSTVQISKEAGLSGRSIRRIIQNASVQRPNN